MTRVSFTAIDFETANAKRGSVCAVGLVRVRAGHVVERFSSLVRPPAGLDYFEYRNIQVHGIYPEDVVRAPRWARVAGQVEDFIGDDLLVAHNVPFDRSVIEQANTVCGLEPPKNKWVCTLRLSKAHLDLTSHRLPSVSAHLGLSPFQHHDASADAEAAAGILLALTDLLDITDLSKHVSVRRGRQN